MKMDRAVHDYLVQGNAANGKADNFLLNFV